MRSIEIQRYLVAFIITSAIFATAFFISNSLNEKRVAEIRAIEDRISTDILSLETQFELLAQLSCEEVEENSILSQEIASLADRLAFAESQLGANSPQVEALRKSYTLLLIKDFLLMGRVADKCDFAPEVIYYFYSNEGDCSECTNQGYVLTRLGREHPELRIYSFDYNLDLSALRTLITIYKVENTLPALVIDDEALYGFRSIEEIRELIPSLQIATSTENGLEDENEEE